MDAKSVSKQCTNGDTLALQLQRSYLSQGMNAACVRRSAWSALSLLVMFAHAALKFQTTSLMMAVALPEGPRCMGVFEACSTCSRGIRLYVRLCAGICFFNIDDSRARASVGTRL